MIDQDQMSADQNLELVLVTTSMNHEYTKKQLEQTASFLGREELLARMSHLKNLYFNARRTLAETKPQRLAEIEEDLRQQKQFVFPEYLA